MDEITKHSDPGVWTPRFFDGSGPEYMSSSRTRMTRLTAFLEVQSYCSGACPELRREARRDDDERDRSSEAAAGLDHVSPRANTNLQESAIPFSFARTARTRKSTRRLLEEQARHQKDNTVFFFFFLLFCLVQLRIAPSSPGAVAR